MSRISLLFSLLTLSCALHGADTLRVLFVGNSYTAVQNLPQVISKLASAAGDSLYYQVNAPGGYTLQQHSNDNVTLGYIAQGNWDFVVLQEQSQRPSFEDAQVAIEVYPYARKLDSLIHYYNPCAKTAFYMTWGRKNGDAQNCALWPPVCTYEGMDSLLELRYSIMAEDNRAFISPVAKVWRHLRNNTPSLELYQADESHPSPAGTYAAALSFYSLFFGKNPVNNSYNFTLNATEANVIKTTAEMVVFDSLDYWRRFYPMPAVDSVHIIVNSDGSISCTGINPQHVVSYTWDFGDNTALSHLPNPSHTYNISGVQQICLTVHGVCDSVVYCTDISIGPLNLNIDNVAGGMGLSVYPNPTRDYLKVTGTKELAMYSLINNIGYTVGTGKLKKDGDILSLKTLAAGIYFLKIQDQEGQVRVLKIVKE